MLRQLTSFTRRNVLVMRQFAEAAKPKARSRVSLVTDISDNPGALHNFLKAFWKFDINLTHIESKPTPKELNNFHMYIDFDGNITDAKTEMLLNELRDSKACNDIMVLDDRTVPWFPRDRSDLDFVANRVFSYGAELDADHPGFKDPQYRERRAELASLAVHYRAGSQIPRIEYTDEENKTWGAVYRNMMKLQDKYACAEYLQILPLMEKHCGFSDKGVPQVCDISAFLKERTGFTLRPVAGLLSSRDFLNGLAFRIFFSTQYIRHGSRPMYTPEPDICHELLGHAPMFADPDFADFSQEIGLASLGATDEDVAKLAKLYWFTVEFGLVRDSASGETKAFGAGLLSSCGELEYSASAERRRKLHEEKKELKPGSELRECWSMEDAEVELPETAPFDPAAASVQEFPITHYQPKYFVSESLNDAKMKIRAFCESMPKPFHVRYNENTGRVWVDRAVKRLPHNAPQAY